MYITNDFIFVHIPKTGGSYVNAVLHKLYRKSRLKSIIEKHIYNRQINSFEGHFKSNDVYDNLNGFEYNQHCGLRHIDNRYLDKPLFHVKRKPLDYYKSLYAFAWYKIYPHLDDTTTRKKFKSFPNLNWEEVFKYYQLLTEKILDKENLNYGYLTYQLIDMLSPTLNQANEVFNHLDNNDINGALELFRTFNPTMNILNMDMLNNDLEHFLMTYSKRNKFSIERAIKTPKQNVSNNKIDYGKLNDNLMEEMFEKETFTYLYWSYEKPKC